MAYKGDYIVGFFNLLKKNFPSENVIPMNEIVFQYRNML